MSDQVFHQVRRSPLSNKPEDTRLRVCYQEARGRVSVTDLLAHLAETIPSVPLEEIILSIPTLRWVESATAGEIASIEKAHREKEARTLQWERETYARLKAKFEPANADVLPWHS
jgi:hypothetical protein